MKTRNGFVSNSSSSSFICHNQKISDIANSMFNTILEDWTGFASKKAKANLKKALKDKKIIDGFWGLRMPSCNYDTYLIQIGDDVYINTCHNHIWDIEGENLGDEDAIKDGLFLNIANNVIHSLPKYYDFNEEHICPKCKEKVYDYVLVNGEETCTNCWKGKLNEQK